MTTLELPGRITEDGTLEVQLPSGLPIGDVTVRIDLPAADKAWDEQPWTEEEIRELMKPHIRTNAEIVALLQEMDPIEFVDPEITDATEWVKAQCRKY